MNRFIFTRHGISQSWSLRISPIHLNSIPLMWIQKCDDITAWVISSHYSNVTYPRSLLQPVTLHSISLILHYYSHNCHLSIYILCIIHLHCICLYNYTFDHDTMTDHHGKTTTDSAVNACPPADAKRRHDTDHCTRYYTVQRSVNRDDVISTDAAVVVSSTIYSTGTL